MLLFFLLGCFVFSTAFGKLDVLLINLDKRKDKLEVSEFQLNWLGQSNYTRVSGVDGVLLFEKLKKFPRKAVSEILHQDWIRADRQHFVERKAKHYGCTLSHLKALKYIIDRNITNPVLILEDDFVADGDAIWKTEKVIQMLPRDWSLFYAGHCHGRFHCSDYKLDGYSICKIGHGLIPCAHAFVVNGAKAAEKFFNAGNVAKLPLADFFVQNARQNRFIIYPYLFSQLRMIKADVQSGGGTWHKMKNETLLNTVKETFLF